MKRTIKSYQTPKADVILISTEGVLCASDSKNGFDMGPMDKVDENENPSQSYVYDLVFDEAREILITQAMKADGLSDERISELKNPSR